MLAKLLSISNAVHTN